jgi:hypothetical protein
VSQDLPRSASCRICRSHDHRTQRIPRHQTPPKCVSWNHSGLFTKRPNTPAATNSPFLRTSRRSGSATAGLSESPAARAERMVSVARRQPLLTGFLPHGMGSDGAATTVLTPPELRPASGAPRQPRKHGMPCASPKLLCRIGIHSSSRSVHNCRSGGASIPSRPIAWRLGAPGIFHRQD